MALQRGRIVVSVVLCAGLLASCRGPALRAMTEQVGGRTIRRPFASAVAYEAYFRAEFAASRGRWDDALRQLSLAATADPSDPWLPARTVEIQLRAGRHGPALDAAREAVRDFPEAAVAWLALGEARIAAGDREGATAAFSRALGLAPGDPEVRSSVARAQGAGADAVARAMETAPDARVGDRTVAQRLALDPMRDDRPTLRTVRWDRAQRAFERMAWPEVEALLGPIVRNDPRATRERLLLIEARVRDGRLRDAARLVATVSTSSGSDGVRPGDRARLWLRAGRAELAVEEAERAVRLSPDDGAARGVLGAALLQAGALARGLTVLAEIGPTAPQFAEARIVAADGLRRIGHPEAADALLAATLVAIPAEDAPARDRIRVARAAALAARGQVVEARAVVAAIETPAGRQQRGAWMLAVDPTATPFGDLRIRTRDPQADARADAWIALLCHERPGSCAPGEGDRALANAIAHALLAPETLRARAAVTTDRNAGRDWLREAAVRDPENPWNLRLRNQTATSTRPRSP